MSCCATSDSKPSKYHDCPRCSTKCTQVLYSTILLHIKKPWKNYCESLVERTYYFCADSNCKVVYFTGDNLVISKSELRTLVGIKELGNDDALACYCFDITLSEAKNNSELKQFVIDKTKNKLCSCESQNPSGRCCLKDFPK